MASNIELKVKGKPVLFAPITQDAKGQILHWLKMQILDLAAEWCEQSDRSARMLELAMREAHNTAARLSWSADGIQDMATTPDAILYTLYISHNMTNGPRIEIDTLDKMFEGDRGELLRVWNELMRASGMSKPVEAGEDEPPKKD